ncbi:MAG: aminoacyl-tRNA deacylase, partial [Armatimonadetes bacterium]|nr:aminoacyl-tRNA deacylase [Candidatus Hippobium faecium]
MRLRDGKKISYKAHSYTDNPTTDGEEIACYLGEDPHKVFKTLVTVGKTGEHYVFAVPVCDSLDLKKAAKTVGEKSIEMIKQKELYPLTGYVHGGCSPIGMKKFFRTTFHETAKDFDTVFFSAGRIGYQVEMNIEELKKIIR